MEQHYFECQCSDFSHVFRFVMDEEDGQVHLESQLDMWSPWYKRLWLALFYVLGLQRRGYGHYDVTLVRLEDFHRLHDLLDRAKLLQLQHADKRAAELALKQPTEKPLLKG
jgi:hypothetical protein